MAEKKISKIKRYIKPEINFDPELETSDDSSSYVKEELSNKQLTDGEDNLKTSKDQRHFKLGKIWIDRKGRVFYGKANGAPQVKEDTQLDNIKKQGQQEIEQAKADALKNKIKSKVQKIKQNITQ